MSAVGFFENSHEETVQSIAFFNDPGTPIAYSGVQMRIASAERSSPLNCVIVSGGVGCSRSGLKWGSDAMPVKIFRSILSFIRVAIAFRSERLEDCVRVLPQIATTDFFLAIN